MWILFALTSATILASRKIQEKYLVWGIGNSLGWMMKVWASLWAIIAWLIFSRSLTGIDDPVIWNVVLYEIFAYPIMTFFYYKAMHHLPLSIFGMLAPVVPITALIVSWMFLDAEISTFGFLGIAFISIGIVGLFWKHQHKDISLLYLIYAIIAFMIMGIGGVIDKIALWHTNPYTYALINQTVAAVVLFVTSYFLFGWPKVHLFRENIKLIWGMGIIQWAWWICGMFAIAQAANVGYAVALINTHAILTTLYGIFILKEKITKRKVFVFLCMMGALIAFAFA